MSAAGPSLGANSAPFGGSAAAEFATEAASVGAHCGRGSGRGVALAQRALLDLAHRVARQVVDEVHVLRYLETGDLRLQRSDDPGLADFAPLAR